MIGKRSSFSNRNTSRSSQTRAGGGTIGVSIPPLREAPIVASPSIATILHDHVSLSISCVDRLYLNGYVPLLQAPGHIATFCRQQLNAPIASPALFRPLLDRFTHAVTALADQHAMPIIHFSRGQKKDAIAAQQPARFTAEQGLAFESLDNGFRWCADPARLQRICDRLGPSDVQRFFDRWLQRLPWPLTTADRAAGYGHRLTIWQLEVSLTQVFDAPLYGRQFFETVIGDNLDLGRPARINL